MGTIPTPPDQPGPGDGGWQSGSMAGPVPHRADRWARPGEMCSCGLPALVVYENTGGDNPYCGGAEHKP